MVKVGSIQKTKGGPVYPSVGRALQKLGADISLARRSRGMSTEDFSTRMGVSRATLQRLEAGDAGCSLNTFASALSLLGKLNELRDLVDQGQDNIGLMLARQKVPKRIRSKAKIKSPVKTDDFTLDEGVGW